MQRQQSENYFTTGGMPTPDDAADPTDVKLSTRLSLRWYPEGEEALPAAETTDTLVLSVGDWYMDLRVDRTRLKNITSDEDIIDWAMAGQRIVVSAAGEPEKVQFTHEIDSRGYTAVDEGTFRTLPNGDSLESGEMPNPEAGDAVTRYEEVWKEVAIPAGPDLFSSAQSTRNCAWILMSTDDGPKTFLGRAGGAYLALQKGVNGFAAKREELDSDRDRSWGAWMVKYSIGDCVGLPSIASAGLFMFEREHTWSVGKELTIVGRPYVVKAYSTLVR